MLTTFLIFSSVVAVAYQQNAELDATNFKLSIPTSYPRLNFLGRVGLKSYFADNTRNMNWVQAKKFCEDLDMVLGSIETTQELDFLSNAYNYQKFYSWYWTAARDSQKLSQLNWDKKNRNGTEIPVNMELYISSGIKPALTCGAIYVRSTLKIRFDMYPCTTASASLGVLCEAS